MASSAWSLNHKKGVIFCMVLLLCVHGFRMDWRLHGEPIRSIVYTVHKRIAKIMDSVHINK
jgi:hypothetical protein